MSQVIDYIISFVFLQKSSLAIKVCLLQVADKSQTNSFEFEEHSGHLGYSLRQTLDFYPRPISSWMWPIKMLLSHHLVPRSVDEIASTSALQHTLPALAHRARWHNESLNGYEASCADYHCGWYRYPWFALHSPRSGFSRPQRLHVLSTAPHDANTAVSSKEGAVIVSTWNAHRGQHWLQAQE
jgi:hypothetical protein